MNSSLEPRPSSSPKPGDIVEMGAHRLLVGDCRDAAAVARLVGGDKVDLIATDPPYGCAAVESKASLGHALKASKPILGDQLQSDSEYRAFTAAWLNAVAPHLARKNSCYVFNSDKMVFPLRDGMADAGFRISQLLVWVKSQPVMGRLDYIPQHELIAYGWRGKHAFRRSKDKSVLFHPKPASSPFHPSTKPIPLVMRLVLNSSPIGGVVYDCFLGSGTTLLACEKSGRRCLAVEADPEHCATAIWRWERMTGSKAIITSSDIMAKKPVPPSHEAGCPG